MLENLKIEHNERFPYQSYYESIYIDLFEVQIDEYKRKSFSYPKDIKDIEFFSVSIWVSKKNIDLKKLKKFDFQVKPYLKKEWEYNGKKYYKFDKEHTVKPILQVHNSVFIIIYPKISKNDLEDLLNYLKDF